MKKDIVHEDYELSTLTMLVTPQFDEFGNIYSKVIEEERDLLVRKSPLQIIKDACDYFGSNLRGRQKATESIAEYTYKLPVAIEPHNQIYFFPTASPTSDDCSWLSHTHILRIYPMVDNDSQIVFTNGQRYHMDVSEHTLTNQLYRTAQLRFLIERRFKVPKYDFGYPHLPFLADPRRYFQPFS